ncbi:MAG TPA: cytidylate kinase-like family protein [Acidimicrobiales bacterium]|nr:cytidylate kinase-like family protein [Acidimicrobiales bacterium]
MSSVICISHETGAGGPELGRLVADKLGYRLIDEEIVTRAAEKQNVSAEELADAERRKSLLSRILREATVGMGSASGAGMIDAADLRSDPNSLRSLIRQSVSETADEGDVVIVSHAASYALADRPNVLRVLVTASPATRAARVAAETDVDEKHGAKAVGASDAARADYLKRFYSVAEELPVHYDVVVNTDRIPVDQWSQVVVNAATL